MQLERQAIMEEAEPYTYSGGRPIRLMAGDGDALFRINQMARAAPASDALSRVNQMARIMWEESWQ